jgi:hypothetical protein
MAAAAAPLEAIVGHGRRGDMHAGPSATTTSLPPVAVGVRKERLSFSGLVQHGSLITTSSSSLQSKMSSGRTAIIISLHNVQVDSQLLSLIPSPATGLSSVSSPRTPETPSSLNEVSLPDLPLIKDSILERHARTHVSRQNLRKDLFEESVDNFREDYEKLALVGDAVLKDVLARLVNRLYPRLAIGTFTVRHGVVPVVGPLVPTSPLTPGSSTEHHERPSIQ